MQVLFVLKDHRIAFWKFQRGRLVRGSLNGNNWNDYTSTYWSDWSAVNQSGDAVDAVLLSDQPVEKLGELPSWFHVPDGQTSSWKVDTLTRLANDREFADVGIVVCVGLTRCELAHRSWAENFWLYPSKGSLASAVLELEAKRAAEVRRVEDEAKKKEIEERQRKEEEVRIAEVNRRNAETISAANNRQQMSNAQPNGDAVQNCGKLARMVIRGVDDSNQRTESVGATDERVKLWLSRVSTQSVQVQCAVSAWLPKESSFDTFRIRDRIKKVAQTGKAVCLSNRVSASVANKILAELRKCGADGFVTKCETKSFAANEMGYLVLSRIGTDTGSVERCIAYEFGLTPGEAAQLDKSLKHIDQSVGGVPIMKPCTEVFGMRLLSKLCKLAVLQNRARV